MLPWTPTRYPLTHFLTKYIHINDIDALFEPPIHYIKNLIPPCLPQLDIEMFLTSSFYDVTPCLLPLITQVEQTFDYHSISINVWHCKRLKIMHGPIDHGLIWPIGTIFFWQIYTAGCKWSANGIRIYKCFGTQRRGTTSWPSCWRHVRSQNSKWPPVANFVSD